MSRSLLLLSLWVSGASLRKNRNINQSLSAEKLNLRMIYDTAGTDSQMTGDNKGHPHLCKSSPSLSHTLRGRIRGKELRPHYGARLIHM